MYIPFTKKRSRHLCSLNLILTVLLLLSYTDSHEQVLQNIYNGCVVTLQNDTLRGELDVVSPQYAQSPSSIGFRKKTDYNFKKYYSAPELKAVYLYSAKTKDTLIFHCKNVSINFNERLAKQFNPNLPNIRKDTTLFLRAFVLGKANLYYFEDASGSPYYFLEKKGEKIKVLIDQTKKVTDNTQDRNLDFRNQLYQSLKDCTAFDKNTFNKVNLSINDLTKLLNAYNIKMKSSTPLLVTQTLESPLGYGLMLSMNQSFVNQYSWNHHTSGMTPSVGAWFSIHIHPKIPLTVVGEFEYSTFQTSAEQSRSITVLHYYDSLSLKSNYLRMNALMRYDYNISKKTQLYAKTGASYGNIIKSSIYQKAYSYDELLLKTTPLFNPKIRSNDLSFILAVGIQQKKLSLELRYRLSNGYSSADMIQTTVHTTSLNLSWNIAKNRTTLKSQIKEK